MTGSTTTRLLTRIRKAEWSKKNEIWHNADLSREEAESLVRRMIMSVPAGHYRLHNRQYGTNLVDTVWELYGLMPAMFVSESMMLGLHILYPDKVYASFTLGLDAIEIK